MIVVGCISTYYGQVYLQKVLTLASWLYYDNMIMSII